MEVCPEIPFTVEEFSVSISRDRTKMGLQEDESEEG